MNIILNYIPLKSGGGVQVGLDFISNINDLGNKHNWYLVCTENTPFQCIPDSDNLKLVKVIKNNVFSRLWFELFVCRSLLKEYKADVVYTQFGPYWYGSNVINIVGCAYSNLMYPELDFWQALPPIKKAIKNLIDVYRKKLMLSSDVIIYETEDLANRAISQNNLSKKKVFFVRPSPSSLVAKYQDHNETRIKCKSLPKSFLVLLLAGYHPNKNIELLPGIAVELKSRGIKDIKFVVTLPKDNNGTQKILDLAENLQVSEYIYNFEPVVPEGCSELYRSVDLVILPARLESFSNNISESWAMEKPFMISNLDWARSICGDGAAYFNFDDAFDAADKIIEIKNNDNLRNQLISSGIKMLKSYPDSRDRFSSYLKIIESTFNQESLNEA